MIAMTAELVRLAVASEILAGFAAHRGLEMAAYGEAHVDKALSLADALIARIAACGREEAS